MGRCSCCWRAVWRREEHRAADGFDVVSEDCEKEIEYPYTN